MSGTEKILHVTEALTDRQLHSTNLSEAELTRLTERRVLHALVREAEKHGVDEADVLHSAEVHWRCEARVIIKPTKEPE